MCGDFCKSLDGIVENMPINAVSSQINNEHVTQDDKMLSFDDQSQQNMKFAYAMKDNLQCGQCEYKAGRKDNLKRHIQVVHQRIKNVHIKYNAETINCGQCEYKGRKDNVQRHVNVVHKKMKFKCGQCNYEIARQDKLQRHVKKVHDVVQNLSNIN